MIPGTGNLTAGYIDKSRLLVTLLLWSKGTLLVKKNVFFRALPNFLHFTFAFWHLTFKFAFQYLILTLAFQHLTLFHNWHMPFYNLRLTFYFCLLTFDIILHLPFDFWHLPFDFWHLTFETTWHHTLTWYWHKPSSFSLMDSEFILAIWKRSVSQSVNNIDLRSSSFMYNGIIIIHVRCILSSS